MRQLRMALALSMALAGSSAHAEGWYDDDTFRAGGFYLHFEVGSAAAQSKPTDDSDVTVKGAGGAFSLALGACIGEALAVGGEVWDVVSLYAKAESGGYSENVDRVSLFGFGPTVRLNLAPRGANLFLVATPSLTQYYLDDEGGSDSSKWGYGGRVALGKEWMLPRSQWGIGAAVQLVYSLNESETSGKLQTLGGGISFSMTMR